MMAYLVRYRTDTGQIDGIYHSEVPAMLEANRIETAGIAYLLTEEVMPLEQQEHYEVQREMLVAKTELRLQAFPETLPADGQTESHVQVSPWRPCTLRVTFPQRRSPVDVALTDDEPALVLTADMPTQFAVSLVPMPGYWAHPLTVEVR